MLSSHKIDYKLPDSEMDDVGEKMNTDVKELRVCSLIPYYMYM